MNINVNVKYVSMLAFKSLYFTVVNFSYEQNTQLIYLIYVFENVEDLNNFYWCMQVLCSLLLRKSIGNGFI